MTDIEEKTEFTFDELSEEAKDKARSDYTSGEYLHDEWWEHIYYDAVNMGQMLGIRIGTTTHQTSRGGGYSTINIYFSGFCSQGDGACFDGDYHFAPDAVKDITAETNDKELLRIAQELTLMQLTQRLQGREYFTGAIVVSSGNNIRTEIRDWGVDEIGELDEKKFSELMRDFAGWIYKRLEEENDYLYSDEYVDEQLSESDCVFDESGTII
jgi:hypothetical protein